MQYFFSIFNVSRNLNFIKWWSEDGNLKHAHLIKDFVWNLKWWCRVWVTTVYCDKQNINSWYLLLVSWSQGKRFPVSSRNLLGLNRQGSFQMTGSWCVAHKFSRTCVEEKIFLMVALVLKKLTWQPSLQQWPWKLDK